MAKLRTEKGNTLLIVLILLVVVSAGGYYLYSNGKLSLNTNNNVASQYGYVLPTSSPLESVATSNEITLKITSPVNGAILNTSTMIINGKTSPDAEIFVNDKSTKADANGDFSLTVSLDEGENSLLVSANDSEGNVAEQSLSVNVQTF